MKAIVTGGTSGIGKEISRQFLERGDEVVAIYAGDDKKAKNVVAEFNNPKFSIVKLDVTDEVAVKAFFESQDTCDFLVNSAGISYGAKHFPEVPMSDVKRVIDVNLFGKMNCAKHVLPLLQKSSMPRIVNIASRYGSQPYRIGMMAYACAQAAVIMMSKQLALDYAQYGVRTNTVSPALTITPMTTPLCTPEHFDQLAAKNPCGRLGTCADIANMVMFLCSDKADFVNGENINVNGGLTLL